MIASIDFIIWTIKHYKFTSLKFLEGKCQSYYQIRKLMWHKNIDFFFIVLENEKKKKKISCICNPRVDLCSFFRIANTWEFFSFSSIIKKKFEKQKKLYIFLILQNISTLLGPIFYFYFSTYHGDTGGLISAVWLNVKTLSVFG